MIHRRVGKLIGTLCEGSTVCEPPMAFKEKGVVWIAVHPDEPPRLVTPWGIKPLTFIPEADPARIATRGHSISTNAPSPRLARPRADS